MKTQLLRKVARILSILFILFISIFAFDIFEEGYSTMELIIALFMHLIPSIVLAILTWVAWKNEKWGGSLFFVAGICFTVFFNTYEQWASFLLLTMPLIVIGALFIASWMQEQRIQRMETKM